MKSIHGWLGVIVGWLAVPMVMAGQITDIRMWKGPETTRLVFDVDQPLRYRLFTLDNPKRVVIDFPDTRLKTRFDDLDFSGTPIARMRAGIRKGDDLRVVLDLHTAVQPKAFPLKPNQRYGHRVLLDIDRAGRSAQRPVAPTRVPVKTVPPADQSPGRDLMIAIDAGHGGEDPGALGRKGTLEKDVVLAIARRLKQFIDKEPGMRAVLVREGDYYLRLRQRMAVARRHQADLFVSIHADAFKQANVKGASVYTLSERGASSEAARWLAEKENASDLIGGVSLEDKDHTLAEVLLDLAQTATNEISLAVADSVLASLKRIGPVHNRRVQQAGFMVLKSPDIPSILVETAFISNPLEERRLRSARYQNKIARAILAGIRNYFLQNPLPGTYLANRRQHVIARGETLSDIAQQYRVSVSQIKTLNNITGDLIRVGQRLEIPRL